MSILSNDNKPAFQNYSCFTESSIDEVILHSASKGTSNFWIMDSGASKSYCYDRNQFTNFVPCSATSVTIVNGAKLPVEGKGDVTILALQDCYITGMSVFFHTQNQSEYAAHFK